VELGNVVISSRKSSIQFADRKPPASLHPVLAVLGHPSFVRRGAFRCAHAKTSYFKFVADGVADRGTKVEGEFAEETAKGVFEFSGGKCEIVVAAIIAFGFVVAKS
jgi:hypothetical protein